MTYSALDHDFIRFINPQDYMKILSYNNDAACILSLQLIVERFLNVYLKETIREDQKEFFGKDSNGEYAREFQGKISVAVAFGLPPLLARALKHLSRVRNRFAHDFDHSVDESKDLAPFIQLINQFQTFLPPEYSSLNELGPDSGIRAIHSGSGSFVDIRVKDGLREGFVIATHHLMTKAGIWLANDLHQRGSLRTRPIDASTSERLNRMNSETDSLVSGGPSAC